MNPQSDCIVSKNTCFQEIIMGTEKKSKQFFLLQENIEDTTKNQFSIYPRTMNIHTWKESDFQIFYVINIMNFSKLLYHLFWRKHNDKLHFRI